MLWIKPSSFPLIVLLHPKYASRQETKDIKPIDEKRNIMGETVMIQECRPLSKDKI